MQQPHHTGRRGREILSKRSPIATGVFLTCLGLFAVVMTIAAVYGASALKMKGDVDRIIASSQNLANSALGCGGDASISDSARELVRSTQSLRDEMGAAKWTWLAEKTGYSSDLAAAREMLDSVGTIVDGPFADMVNVSQQLQGFEMQDDTVDVSPLMTLPDIVKKAHTDLGDQVKQLESIPTPRLTQVADVLETEKTVLRTADSTLAEYDDLINLLPQLLGKNGSRTYLVLVQNPAELRSSGGMVGNAAAVTADNGKVHIGKFASTIDWTIPDNPLDDQVNKERVVFGSTFDQYAQTTTIDPDFKRVAQLNKYLWLHQKGNEGKNLVGVLALDPVFLQSMLAATGNVTLSDGRVLDGTSTVPFFLSDLYTDYPNFEEQNRYTEEAATQIMNNVLGGANTTNVSAMLKAVRDTTANGHFKLWMADDAEQAALINTGLIDDKASGELSADAATPESGIYLSELQQGKQDWYLRTTTTVKKTCGDLVSNTALNSGVINDSIKTPAMNTTLNQYPEDQLGDEYTVTFTLKNTLTEEQANSLPDFVVGNGDDQVEVRGGMLYRVVLTAPMGGEITAVQADLSPTATHQVANNPDLYDRQYVTFDQDWIKPGEEKTISYTVRVSKSAKSALNVVTTPIVGADGIETGSKGAVDDACPTESRSTGEAVQQEGQQTDQGAAPAEQQNAEGQQAEQQPADSTQQQATEQKADENQQNTQQKKDPAAGLSSLDNLKNSLSCPVDLRKISGAV